MPLKVWDGSNWTMAGQMKVWNGSSWAQLQAAKVWNGSSWVQFHPGVQLLPYTSTGSGSGIVLEDDVIFPDPAAASISLGADGSTSYFLGSLGEVYSYNWLLSGSAGDYYAFMDTPSTSSFTTGTVNSPIQLNSGGASWSKARSTKGTSSVGSTLRIRTASGVDIVTISVSLTATVLP